MQHDTSQQVKDDIAALDLEPIKFKFVVEGKCSRENVDVLDKWYRRFLFLTAKFRTQPIVVSEAIDQFWHAHILDTRKYADDCEAVFGKGEFLHHFPYFGLRGEADQQDLRKAYQSTLELMRQEFGETPDEELRVLGTNAADAELASLCSDCGGAPMPAEMAFNRKRPRLSDIAK